MAICPVCKAEVEEKKARGTTTVGERTYYFDTKGCKKQFDEEQEKSIERIGGYTMAKATLGGQEIEIDEDGFIQEPEKWNKEVAEDLAKTEDAYPMGEEALEAGQLSEGLLYQIRDRSTRQDADQTDKARPEEDIRVVPRRTREGRLQDSRSSEAYGLRVGMTVGAEQ